MRLHGNALAMVRALAPATHCAARIDMQMEKQAHDLASETLSIMIETTATISRMNQHKSSLLPKQQTARWPRKQLRASHLTYNMI